MKIPDHLTCLLWTLYPSQEATVRIGHGTIDWFQIGKGVSQGCILSLCLFNLHVEHHVKCWVGGSTSCKKSYGKPRQRIKKQRHYAAYKGLYSQSYGYFSGHVWVWELDNKNGWAPKIDAFKLWWWRRLLRVPWTARRSNQSILEEINHEYSIALMPKLKVQYFAYLMWKADSLEKTLMLGDWRQEEKGTKEDEKVGWHHWLNGHEF